MARGPISKGQQAPHRILVSIRPTYSREPLPWSKCSAIASWGYGR